jgi:hypothetical protein
MAYDQYWSDWHLTKQGWIEGGSDLGSGLNVSDATDMRPEGTVLSVRRHVWQSNAWVPEDITWSERWQGANQGEITRLVECYGRRPGKKSRG